MVWSAQPLSLVQLGVGMEGEGSEHRAVVVGHVAEPIPIEAVLDVTKHVLQEGVLEQCLL